MAQLQITIVEGRNLKKKDLFSESDPYAQIYLDDKREKQKTRVISNSKNPQWNQTFVFNHLHGQNVLYVDVYDKDLFFDDKIGSVKIYLQELFEKQHMDHWYDLSSKFYSSSQGEIHLILDYQRLTV